MATHLYTTQDDWPVTWCDRNRPWHEPVYAVWLADLAEVDCPDCLEALRLHQLSQLRRRQQVLEHLFGPFQHCA